MMKVIIIQQVYNSRSFIPQVYDAMVAQTYPHVEIIAQITLDNGGCKEYISKHYPQVKIIDPGYNIGFSKGHNELFATLEADLFQLVNPDLILAPTYVEEMVKAFSDSQVGAVTGKLLQYDFQANKSTNKIDTTGVVVYKSGSARDRGQHEIDRGQYDADTQLLAVSGAGPMYRKAALEAVKMEKTGGGFEYFDEDFHSYWEDVDLSLRLVNAGYSCVFAPRAVGFHGRTAGSSPGGYKKVLSYIKHHDRIPARIRQLNYKNHIFLYIKNTPHFFLEFFIREFFMLGYIILLEIKTLKVVPELIKTFPRMWQKRKWIQMHRKIDPGVIMNLMK